MIIHALNRTVSRLLTLLLLLSAVQFAVAAEPVQPSILFLGHPNGYLEPALAREMTDKGFMVDHSGWAGLSLERLRRFNAVVIISLGNADQGAASAWSWKCEDLLDEYMRLGGGVTTFFNDSSTFCVAAKPWFNKHGLDMVHMSVIDPANAQDVPRPKYVYGQKFSPADIVLPSPISTGVKAIWYSNEAGGYCLPSANPLIIDANWTAVVKTRATSSIKLYKGAEVRDQNVRLELDGAVGSHTLIASRKIGNGRMVAMGLNPHFYAMAPHFDKFDEIVYRVGINGLPSNFDVLLENSMRWTAEPSMKSGALGWTVGLTAPTTQGDTASINWGPKSFTKAGPWLRGHMGAQTAYSGGTGTVTEWIAAAKTEGLSFLVLLEDMSQMNADKWEQLKKECKGMNGGDFRCYPGMRYRMKIATGGTNHCIVVDGRGTLPWPLERFLTKNNEISVYENMNEAPFFVDFNTNTTVGFMQHKDNVTPYWDYKLYGLTSVITRSGDVVVDDFIEQYREQTSANISIAPVGIDLVTKPEQLKGVIASGRPLLAVNGAHDPRYAQQAAGLGQVDLHVGSLGEESNPGFGGYRGWFGPAVTEGPMVSLRFRGGYTWKGVEYPRYWIERYNSVEAKDWFMPSYHRLPIRLEVASDKPLAEVTIYDGKELLFSFDVAGKTELSTDVVIPQDRNRHLTAFVKDAAGRRAVSMEIWTEQQQQLYNFCGDRINAPSGRGSAPGHGNAWTEGYVSMEPTHKQIAAAYPKTIADTGMESRRFQLDLVSPDVWLERASSERYFVKMLNYMSNPWHNWSEPALRNDVRHGTLRQEWFQMHGRVYRHPGSTGVHWDGYSYGPGDEAPKQAYYATQDNTGETLKDLTPVAGFGFVPGLSQVLWESELATDKVTTYRIVHPDGTEVSGDFSQLLKQGGKLVGDLPTGSTIVIGSGFSTRITGAALGYALQIVVAEDANKKAGLQANLRVAPRSAAPLVKAGTRYSWRYETVAQVLASPLALDAGWMAVTTGKMTDHWVGATIAAERGHVRVTFGKQPLNVNSTPLTVTGLNPNWTVGYLEPKTGAYRPVGTAVNGTAYVQVPTTQVGLDVVVGNVVTCDQPDLRLLVTQDTDSEGVITGGWTIDVHNPTAKAVETVITPTTGFDQVMPATAQKIKIPAGTTVRVRNDK